MHRFSNKGLASILLVLLVALFAVVATADQVATSTKGMVATAHELASQAGAEILAAGGNAIDAAVAAAFAITVVEPNASSLGGEGYMVLSLADGRDLAIDYRSWAPGHVNINTDCSQRSGPESVCIPGVVAGLTLALQEYGTMTLEQVMAPAIRLAKEGFPIDAVLIDRFSSHDFYKHMLEKPGLREAAKIFLEEDLIPEVGTTITNPYLANALELIAKQGAYAFYRGEIADAIVEAMGGWFTSADLQRYQAVERNALVSEYRGYTVIGTPPIVAGIVVAEALNILDNFDLSAYAGWDDPEAIHLISQALLLASADRKPYIGDPDFCNIPLEGLVSKEYAQLRAKLIDPEQALTPTYSAPVGDPYSYESVAVPVGVYGGEESPSTTQISVLDEDGNAVSITQTLSSFWGSQVLIPGYGFFMNNELHNLNTYSPDYPDDVNVVGPYKRPRTVIAPTVVRDTNDEVYLVLGTPGAGRIPSTIVETIVNVIDFEMPLQEAIKAPKFCSRVAYSQLRMEDGYSAETIAALEDKGHIMRTDYYGELSYYFGGMNAIIVEDGTMIGVGSFRRSGGAASP